MAEDTNSTATIYADALIEALTTTAVKIGAPDINAALAALIFTQAYLIAKAPDRNTRRLLLKKVADDLPGEVAARVNERLANAMAKGQG